MRVDATGTVGQFLAFVFCLFVGFMAIEVLVDTVRTETPWHQAVSNGLGDLFGALFGAFVVAGIARWFFSRSASAGETDEGDVPSVGGREADPGQ